MNHSRTKRLPKIIFEQSVVGLIMITLALTVIFYAQGYRINWNNFSIIKTGVVFLVSNPEDVNIYIDGELKETKAPYSESLKPDHYSATIKKEGYVDWSQNFEIKPELVTEYSNVELFLKNVKTEELKDESKIDYLNTPTDVLAVVGEDELMICHDHEIWANDQLVARFSTPVKKVAWYSDDHHILYQQGKEIRVIETSGFNDTLLVKLSSDKTARFVANKKGDELYYNDGGKYMLAHIK